MENNILDLAIENFEQKNYDKALELLKYYLMKKKIAKNGYWKIFIIALEGTYLVWIDCRALGIGSDAMTLRLQEEQKLMINSGTMYGPGGEGFIRLNIACPRTLLVEGLERMARVLEQNEE